MIPGITGKREGKRDRQGMKPIKDVLMSFLLWEPRAPSCVNLWETVQKTTQSWLTREEREHKYWPTTSHLSPVGGSSWEVNCQHFWPAPHAGKGREGLWAGNHNICYWFPPTQALSSAHMLRERGDQAPEFQTTIWSWADGGIPWWQRGWGQSCIIFGLFDLLGHWRSHPILCCLFLSFILSSS